MLGYLKPSSGSIQVKYDIDDRISSQLQRLGHNLKSKKVKIDINRNETMNFRSQIFYMEPEYPIFSGCIEY